jgi:hypothetical protein
VRTRGLGDDAMIYCGCMDDGAMAQGDKVTIDGTQVRQGCPEEVQFRCSLSWKVHLL